MEVLGGEQLRDKYTILGTLVCTIMYSYMYVASASMSASSKINRCLKLA